MHLLSEDGGIRVEISNIEREWLESMPVYGEQGCTLYWADFVLSPVTRTSIGGQSRLYLNLNWPLFSDLSVEERASLENVVERCNTLQREGWTYEGEPALLVVAPDGEGVHLLGVNPELLRLGDDRIDIRCPGVTYIFRSPDPFRILWQEDRPGILVSLPDWRVLRDLREFDDRSAFFCPLGDAVSAAALLEESLPFLRAEIESLENDDIWLYVPSSGRETGNRESGPLEEEFFGR